jgi:hypothetical protein
MTAHHEIRGKHSLLKAIYRKTLPRKMLLCSEAESHFLTVFPVSFDSSLFDVPVRVLRAPPSPDDAPARTRD